MSYPINYPTPQGANIQIFKEGGSTSDWVKPQGASFVWFTLIGGGGGGTNPGDGTLGGGSSAVTNFMGPAFLMPDVLRVSVGKGGREGGNAAGTPSKIIYQAKDGTGYTLLTAENGVGAGGGVVGPGGAATASNYFSAMGIYQSVAGQDGAIFDISPSATTFLSGGGGSTVTANYGYSITGEEKTGFFQMQPIIVGLGSCYISNAGTAAGRGLIKAGIGCGGGGANGSTANGTSGGDGMVVIITW